MNKPLRPLPTPTFSNLRHAYTYLTPIGRKTLCTLAGLIWGQDPARLQRLVLFATELVIERQGDFTRKTKGTPTPAQLAALKHAEELRADKGGV